jgi:hypothetical protein
LELAREVERRKVLQGEPFSPRIQRAAETIEQFRQHLASVVRENRNVSEDEINFWNDRVNANRSELQRRSRENPA